MKFLNRDDIPQPVFLLIHTYQVHDYIVTASPFNEETFDRTITVEQWRDKYADAVKSFDVLLMDLIETLLQSPIAGNLKLIITSDHGEAFGEEITASLEEGLDPATLPLNLFHMRAPYIEQTHIPLIVYGEGRGRIKRLVGLDAIAGTMLTYAGISTEAQTLFRSSSEVVSEYIQYKREDSIRYTAIINGPERYSLRASVDEEQPAGETLKLTEEHEAELKALGYLR
ncbi:MAG: hypothetical protein Kow0099_27390 [Candidatus Abyssubacteria bacterium]